MHYFHIEYLLLPCCLVVGCRQQAPRQYVNPTPASTQKEHAKVSDYFEDVSGIGELSSLDFSEEAKSASFREVVAEVQQRCGVPSQPLGQINGGVCFPAEQAVIELMLDDKHQAYLEKGCSIFVCKINGGTGGARDIVGLLPTTDKLTVVEAVGTDGVNYDIYPDDIIAWLRTLEKEEPFILLGAGTDFLVIRFTGEVKNPKKIARSIVKICPTFKEQPGDPISDLVQELQAAREVTIWWD